MALNVPDVLQAIVARKRSDLAALLPRMDSLAREAEARVAQRRSFRAALEANPPSVIAEVKKASPSKGVFVEDFRPVEIARCYEEGGAACLSVLTDGPFFQGCLQDLEAARGAVNIPVLRKDFTIHEAHVHEAAAHGADAILLIAAILTVDEMRRFRELATSYAMDALVEVHDAEELEAALDSGPEILGVNNRDLRTFGVTLETSLRLANRIPPDTIKVSESGIHSHADVARLRSAGYSSFLVGERLMLAGNPAEALRGLRGA
ncbi:MAG: indole-3-glycerol phosphate synthase TrpC [Bryobacterales bacterium]|nr:indole-3-glycerol phosphate synthase TrpC [Bryobacterales bacterium]